MNDVEAVKTKEGIEYVEYLLRKHYGDLYGDLWRIGVNMAFRISDLLAIEYAAIDFARKQYTTIEIKTNKERTVTLNSKALELIERRQREHPGDQFLFQVHSNRTASMPAKAIHRNNVGSAFKVVGEIVDVHLGTHSMRKSRGWAMHSDGVALELIAKVLNHSNIRDTMRYIGLDKQTVSDTYIDYVL